MAAYKISPPDCEDRQDQQWQQVGTASAIGRIQPGRRSLCTVGLDFGTAFTKACIQVRNSTYVVHWDRAVKLSTPFLLPSVFSEMPDGTCVLGSTHGARLYSDIKMALLGSPTWDNKLNAALFMALATRYIRSWLFSDYRSVVEGFHLDWALNVGLPSSSWDNSATCHLYKKLAVAGWRIGSSPGPITLAAAREMLASVERGLPPPPGHIDNEMVATIPEFGAQIHSYRASAQRQRDLHLLVDVGAGTVDIVTFHIGEEHDTDTEVNCILEPLVRKLGTHVLLAYRAEASSLNNKNWDDSATRLDQAKFELKYGIARGTLLPVQEHFEELLHLSIRKILHLTKSRRYETSPAWTQGVPFFLSGGGRSVDVYREAIAMSKRDRNLFEMSLPTPDDIVLGKVSGADFHRLSVAHGLSFPAENLAKTLRRHEVPDLRRTRQPREDYRDRYIDK
jgi:hypothetical protein